MRFLIAAGMFLILLDPNAAAGQVHRGKTSLEKIEADLSAGSIDRAAAMKLKAQSLVSPDDLPEEYRSDRADKCGFPVFAELIAHLDELPLQEQDAVLQKIHKPLSETASEVFSPSGLFRITFETTGQDAVDPTDNDQNGVPDYIDEVGIAFDLSYQREIVDLGYDIPPDFNPMFGNGFYDIVVADLNVYGQTFFGGPDADPSTPYLELKGSIEIDNDFAPGEGYFTNGLNAMRVTAAHEFHHAIQVGGYLKDFGSINPNVYFFELTSTWLEDVVYDEVNDYYQYLAPYFGTGNSSHARPFDVSNGYNEVLFGQYVENIFGPDAIRNTWENMRDTTFSLDALDLALSARGSSLEEGYTEFMSWNFFTGSRAVPGFYDEAEFFSEVTSLSTSLFLSDASEVAAVDHLSSHFFVYDVTVPGKFDFNFGATNMDNIDFILVHLGDLGTIQTRTVRDASGFEWVIGEPGPAGVIVANTSRDQFEASTSFDAQFEGNVPAKNAVSFFPHPFNLEEHDRIFWQIELAETGTLGFEIYNAGGQRVYKETFPGTLEASFYAGGGPAYPYFWDGRDSNGKRVSGGVYIYVFRINDKKLTGKIAVVR